jgi:Asp-tRNA(Asn)/Glu-tRNA(Gln) amidotransferase A subunit family amidase
MKLTLAGTFISAALFLAPVAERVPPQQDLDRDLFEVTVPKLEALYRAHTYTVTQVVQWHLDRIARYDGVYNAMDFVDRDGALATAAAEDTAAARGGAQFRRGPLWGVPIVIKANTSVKGWVTSAGWSGYLIKDHELVAPDDAPIVAKFRAAGAVLLGHTNMPDFAASDSNISSARGRTGNAYDWHWSPGGSSGGTVTAVTANYAVLGNGTDTGNSIRMPSATSSVVGLLPTRGLVSIAGIHPLDWLLDNTGPIARNATDAAIALSAIAGEDPKDFRTSGSSAKSQRVAPDRLRADALKGKRLGVPAFIVRVGGLLTPETRDAFTKALDGVRAAGATVVIEDEILPSAFVTAINAVRTGAFRLDGMEAFLRDFGPAQYHSLADYQRAVGAAHPWARGPVRVLENDPEAETMFWKPQRDAVAMYDATLDRFHLDGYVYPALSMTSKDETAPGADRSGPHSDTAWVNKIGVPAISVPAGYHANGFPFGLEFSTRFWKDADLLNWAYAYEQTTHARKPPALTDKK